MTKIWGGSVINEWVCSLGHILGEFLYIVSDNFQMLVMVIYCDNIMMLNLIKVKFLSGGEVREFGGEASPLGPPSSPIG